MQIRGINVTEIKPKNTPDIIQDKLGNTYEISKAYLCDTNSLAETVKRHLIQKELGDDVKYLRSRNIIFEYNKILKQNKMRYTSENITHLEENEVFVFGSNKAGIHGAGAAYTARYLFGAKSGVGVGPTGSCYALPTKNEHLVTMSLPEIEEEVQDLLRHAQVNKEQTFLITKVGCGLAGYKEEDIAPMFTEFLMLDNVTLPKEFCKIIKENLTF